MKRIQYYPALETDAELLADMRILMLSELGAEGDEFVVDDLRRELQEYYSNAVRNREYLSWIAFEGNQVAGIGGMVIRTQPGNFRNPSGRVGYLINMYTGPQFRRQGICSNLLRRLTDSARELGVTAFELHATPDGAPVYEKFGFHMHQVPTYRKYEAILAESLAR
jgi:ribosomal protein S18 acetylase RimI-like enzyme